MEKGFTQDFTNLDPRAAYHNLPGRGSSLVCLKVCFPHELPEGEITHTSNLTILLYPEAMRECRVDVDFFVLEEKSELNARHRSQAV